MLLKLISPVSFDFLNVTTWKFKITHVAGVVLLLYRVALDRVCDQGKWREAFLNHMNPPCGAFSNSALTSVSKKTPWPS